MAIPSLDLIREKDVLREVAKRCTDKFGYFARQAWPTLEPGVQLKTGYHWDAIVEHLQAVADGKINKLLINIAPGHGKSTLVSVLFPAWLWTFYPEARWLCASYSLDLAIRDNKNCRDLIESEWYQSLFGDVFQMAPKQNQKSFFENTKRGYRLCTAVRASSTGKRATHLLIDDPNNAMAKPADVLAVVEWYGKTWASRINDRKRGAMITVGQRLDERDLSGYLLELGGWEHLCLPTEFEPERRCFTSIGWSDPRKTEGELLWPQHYTPEDIKAIKHDLKPINYAAQHQQSPVPAGGAIFLKKWFREFTQDDVHYYLYTKASGVKQWLKNQCQIFVSADVAVSEKETADFTAIGIWALTPDKELLLLEVLHEHLSHPDQVKALRLIYQTWQPVYIGIETVAYQLAIVQVLRRADGKREEGSLPIKEYDPKRRKGGGDKVSRATSAAVFYEAEQVFHLRGAHYQAVLQTELLQFPKAAHDDLVDMVSIMCDLITMKSTPEEHKEFARRYKEALRRGRAAQEPELVSSGKLPENTRTFHSNRRPVRPQEEKKKELHEGKITTDFRVESNNPELLDRTLLALPQAHARVLGGGGRGENIVRDKDGYVFVRVFGDTGFFEFAVERQGYCTIIEKLEELYEKEAEA